MKKWFYRFTALHFVCTAITGIILYFRPLDDRDGWYSDGIKDILVGLHNGELWGQLLFDNRYLSGIPIGLILAVCLALFSIRSLRRSP